MRPRSVVLLCAVVALLPACERVLEPADDSQLTLPRFASLPDTDWGPAVRVSGTSLLNTPALEGCPSESPDGRSLFFASNRSGNIDIYVSQRQPDGTWGDPEKLPEQVNSVANDFCPTSLPGGRLMFVSERDDGRNCGPGKADIYEARLDPHAGWVEAVHLGCTINSPGNEFAPSPVGAGGGMLFFSSDYSGNHGIYVSHRGPGGVWQAPLPVAELNIDGYNTLRPNVSQDGREIVFDSDRPDSRGFDVWYSHRATPHSAWAPPVRLSDVNVNSSANETRASFSRDGKRLYFGSNRDQVSFDLFVAERR